MDKTVSIIIPVYNVSRYLPQCLDSVLAQTYPHWEAILIDDGSTDDSGAICDAYAARDGRVRVIHQENAGAANAKNAGLDAAAGDYIAFADSDDWVEPDWLERLTETAEARDADVVECDFWMSYTDGEAPGNEPGGFEAVTFETRDYLRQYLLRWTCALFWNKLFRARLLLHVRFHRERRCVDDEFFTYKAVTGANRVERISRPLYHYRQRRSSVTQTEKSLYQRTVDDIDILAERHRWIKRHYPELAMDYLRHDVDTLLYFANNYPFHDEAVARFRVAARYYFVQSLRSLPGRVTIYYACRALIWPAGEFRRNPPEKPDEEKLRRYFL